MDELDRILLSEPELSPSSRFAAAVMEAVERQAQAPPPLAFPWRGLAAGLAAIAAAALAAWGLAPWVPRGDAVEALPWVAAVLALTAFSAILPWKWLEG